MILNQTKTEVLCLVDDDTVYPKLKKSMKWLGIFLGLNRSGYLDGCIEDNICMIRRKTVSRFSELMYLTTSYKVKVAVLQIYIEPVIDYCLVICILQAGDFQKAIDKLQVVQNTFLRRAAGVGMSAKIEELHSILGVKTITQKLANFAKNEWDKLPTQLTDEHVVEVTRSHRNDGRPIVNGLLDCLAVNRGYQSDIPSTKFCLKSFTKWRTKVLQRSNSIVAQKKREIMLEQKHNERLELCQTLYNSN